MYDPKFLGDEFIRSPGSARKVSRHVVPLDHSITPSGALAPTQRLIDTPPPAAGSALAKASDAEVATASTTISEKHVATPKRT